LFYVIRVREGHKERGNVPKVTLEETMVGTEGVEVSENGAEFLYERASCLSHHQIIGSFQMTVTESEIRRSPAQLRLQSNVITIIIIRQTNSSAQLTLFQ
jgi:hypothetical protein